MIDEPADRFIDKVLDAFDYKSIAKRIKRNSPAKQLPEGWYVGPAEVQLSFDCDDMPESCLVRKPGIVTWDGHTYRLVTEAGSKKTWREGWNYDFGDVRRVNVYATVYQAGTNETVSDGRVVMGPQFLIPPCTIYATVRLQRSIDDK